MHLQNMKIHFYLVAASMKSINICWQLIGIQIHMIMLINQRFQSIGSYDHWNIWMKKPKTSLIFFSWRDFRRSSQENGSKYCNFSRDVLIEHHNLEFGTFLSDFEPYKVDDSVEKVKFNTNSLMSLFYNNELLFKYLYWSL